MSATTTPAHVTLTAIIPVLNEQNLLEENLVKLASHLDAVIGSGGWQFIIVDNGSTDRTPEILKRVLASYPPSRAIHMPNPNYGAALRGALAAAHTPYVHICDIEQWDIPFLAWAWTHRREHDLFIGSKRSDPIIARQPPQRRFLSWGLNALLQLFFDYMGTETHGPKLINMDRLRPVIDQCVSDRGQFDTEIALRAVRAGLRIAEAPIAFVEHRPPRVKLFRKIGWNIVAFNRLRGLMQNVEYADVIEFRQFSRSDVLRQTPSSISPPLAEDIAAADRQPALPAQSDQKGPGSA